MPRKKIKLRKSGNGFYQRMTNPMEDAHGQVKKLSAKLKNPPTKELQKVWPDLKK